METLELLHDSARDRDVPIKVYAPKSGTGPFPVIIFSHGLGSSRQGYVYLGREWASRGFVSIHVQHLASDSELLRTKGRWATFRAAYNRQEYADRPLDVSFVIDVIEARAGAADGGGIWKNLDLARIGVGGHSYGAHTALTLVGMLVNFPEEKDRSFRDERVKAALILSPPTMDWSPEESDFASIRVPTMHMSGTRDSSWFWRTTLKHRRRAFDSIRGAPRYFLNIDDAEHLTFADRETMELAKRNGRLDTEEPPVLMTRDAGQQRHVDLILEYSDLFWDAYLVGSDKARGLLQSAQPTGAVLERGE
ncbi:MAG: alpha/beta hydrolase family protein [Thermoanaerobaculia bacterium]